MAMGAELAVVRFQEVGGKVLEIKTRSGTSSIRSESASEAARGHTGKWAVTGSRDALLRPPPRPAPAPARRPLPLRPVSP